MYLSPITHGPLNSITCSLIEAAAQADPLVFDFIASAGEFLGIRSQEVGSMAISINTLHPLFAARASGIDLSRPIDATDFKAIKADVDQYGVLLLQGPRLTSEEQIGFAGRFGTMEPQNGRC